MNLSPRETDSAQALRLLSDGFDYLGELDFPIHETHGRGFVFRAWLEPFKANGCSKDTWRTSSATAWTSWT